MSNFHTISKLGWSPFFQQQLTLDEWGSVRITRVMEHHRTGLILNMEPKTTVDHATYTLAISVAMPEITVGDWVLLDEGYHFLRVLERSSEFGRKAAGSKLKKQLIAANVDTVFLVCSLNDDFNLSRIERYLTLIHDAGSEPVVVLSKADCCTDVETYVHKIRNIDAMLMVETVNGLDRESVNVLEPWCRHGKTVAFVGSSGVGKSTLVNTLMGDDTQETGGIRADDSKGRHTTTSRSLSIMPNGALLLDTPGMRELQLAASEHGIAEAFSDISEFSRLCKFADCQHEQEPQCAVIKAVEAGVIEPRRLKNYHKLKREQEKNGASLAQIHSQNRKHTKMIRVTQKQSRSLKKE
jgi:ribosome biogenesis GTPase